MDINKLNRGINSYNTIQNARVPKASGTKAPAASGGSFDSVEIDFGKSMEAAKANIAARLSAEANIARIRELQEKYAGDNCPVSPEEIAEAIVGGSI